ncbi:MAG: hypothetical protein V3U92_12950 [Cellulophaga sp.]
MKTKKIVLTISFFVTLLGIQNTVAQTTIGGGIGYGTEIENVGVVVNGQFFINDQLSIAPDFTYYFPKNIADGFNFKWYEINANANYYFNTKGSAKFYGLGGINFSIISIPTFNLGGLFEGAGQTSNISSSKLGLNLGGGVDFDLDSTITPFAQLKYTISSFDQLVIVAGVRFKI